MTNPDTALPADIAAAIETYGDAKYGQGYFYDGDDDDRPDAARAALDAAILSRLTAAEASRDAAIQERDEAMACLRENIGKWATIEVLRSERDDALARVERLEKALEFYADEQNYRMNGPLDPNSSWFDGNNRARAALAEPAPAEEVKP